MRKKKPLSTAASTLLINEIEEPICCDEKIITITVVNIANNCENKQIVSIAQRIKVQIEQTFRIAIAIANQNATIVECQRPNAYKEFIVRTLHTAHDTTKNKQQTELNESSDGAGSAREERAPPHQSTGVDDLGVVLERKRLLATQRRHCAHRSDRFRRSHAAFLVRLWCLCGVE
jgi:hypothetical protein